VRLVLCCAVLLWQSEQHPLHYSFLITKSEQRLFDTASSACLQRLISPLSHLRAHTYPAALVCALSHSLQRAIDFYTHVLNARVLRHEEYDSDCPATCNGKPSTPSASNSSTSSAWSKTIVGLSDERSFCFELIYNYSTAGSTAPMPPTPHTPSSASAASPFRYVTINIPGAASRAKTAGWRIDTVDDGEGNALAVVCGPAALRTPPVLERVAAPVAAVPARRVRAGTAAGVECRTVW